MKHIQWLPYPNERQRNILIVHFKTEISQAIPLDKPLHKPRAQRQYELSKMLREENVADRADRIKFNGTIRNWPVQKQSQTAQLETHRTRHNVHLIKMKS